MIVRAPAKLNLCLFLGGARADGLHELRSLFCPLALSDRIAVSVADGEADEVVCPGVEGPNLVAAALDGLRARWWGAPPLRVEVDKRIPVAAGLGGGSADAAALLRIAASGFDGASVSVEGIAELALGLGADVFSQLEPAFALVAGAGEVVEALPEPGAFALVLIPGERGLATREVYAEADRLGLGRRPRELDELGQRLRAAASPGRPPQDYREMLANDLQHAALSLRPEIAEALEALEAVGAALALVTGSGPTAFGVFDDIAAADRAAAGLPPRYADAIVTAPQTLGRVGPR